MLVALLLGLPLLGCATDLGTGNAVVTDLRTSYPTTVGRLVTAYLDPSRRLRVYLQICADAGPDGPICSEEDLRVLAMVESNRKKLLQRLAGRYLQDGRDKPVYVYGPMCEGFEEMIVVPRCQNAVAIGIWDPHLQDYVVYSTLHGDSILESEGFSSFLEATGTAAGVVKKASKVAF
ncbi:MAG: hypothetical protein ABFS46_15025 [Myxococcota bacterium]